jgi:MFS family permease
VIVAFGGVAMWGLFTAVVSGPSRTVLQRATPEEHQGRVLAADLTAGNAALLVGTVVAGPAIHAWGVRPTVAALGGLAALVGLVARQAGASSPLATTRSTESVL